ncbi:hypothetical protein MUN77_01420 [Leucobacter allii]|uniref:hypothetical protein n=1 Tax=Leucobacter allii TaxID=2932247 RepID=UPI001FD0E7A5|nr:hypothetical protein [Leucobacter allii]UOR03475.1 hypothetical protein MUN77_01420 [Leucobacter allii]
MQIAAREFSTEELCRYATEYDDLGERHIAALYMDAISLHAREIGWGELIRRCMNDWKEVPDHAEDPHESACVHPFVLEEERLRAVTARDR